jgi:hypothetical protein
VKHAQLMHRRRRPPDSTRSIRGSVYAPRHGADGH